MTRGGFRSCTIKTEVNFEVIEDKVDLRCRHKKFLIEANISNVVVLVDDSTYFVGTVNFIPYDIDYSLLFVDNGVDIL